VIALLDSHEPAIVELIRPNGDGKSFLDLARGRHRPLLEAIEARGARRTYPTTSGRSR
jgi:hypothetical protein